MEKHNVSPIDKYVTFSNIFLHMCENLTAVENIILQLVSDKI